ncbi:hypothetical protein D3C87_1973310 [compost metagenome]
MRIGEALVYLAFVVSWVCGIAVAKGFWITVVCVVLPPVAWVLLAQHLMGVVG